MIEVISNYTSLNSEDLRELYCKHRFKLNYEERDASLHFCLKITSLCVMMPLNRSKRCNITLNRPGSSGCTMNRQPPSEKHTPQVSSNWYTKKQ